MATRKVGRLVLKNTALFICDMQEAFRQTVKYYPQIINVAGRLLSAAKILEMPVIVTEQYPLGLGSTVSELDVRNYVKFPKTAFSMLVNDVQLELKKHPDLKSVVLCGIEAHACIQQTALDLVEQDYDVHVVVDAVSGRDQVDRMFAFQRMKEAGAHLTTCESVLLELLRNASHPKFKEVIRLVKNISPDSALLVGPYQGTPPA